MKMPISDKFVSPKFVMLVVLSGCATQPHHEQATTPIASTAPAREYEIRSQCEKEWINPDGKPRVVLDCAMRQEAIGRISEAESLRVGEASDR